MNTNKLLIVLLVLFVILAGAGGYGTYYFYKQAQKQKTSVKELQKQIDDLKKQQETSKTEASTETTSKKQETEWQSCAEFTAEERAEMADWRSYSNDTYNYTFKYPHDWTVSAESPELVTIKGEDNGEEISFQVRVGRMTEIGFGEYRLTFSREVKVNCEKAKENTYDAGDNQTVIAHTFTKADNPYVLIFSFKDIGASYAADIVHINNLILKTFQFSS